MRRIFFIVLILAACGPQQQDVPKNKPFHDVLRKMFGDHRAMVARLSGGFAHAPVQEEGRRVAFTNWKLPDQSTGNTAFRGPLEHGASHLEIIISLLGSADTDTLSKAVRGLNRLITLDHDRPLILSDLAACYYYLATQEGQVHLLVEAFDLLTRARALSPDTPEILFNLALVFERLGLPDQALGTWRVFSSVEKDPNWLLEAYERTRVLRGRPNWDERLPLILDGISRGEPVDHLFGGHESQAERCLRNKLLPEAVINDDFQLVEKFDAHIPPRGAFVRDSIDFWEKASPEQRIVLEKAMGHFSAKRYREALPILHAQDHPYALEARYQLASRELYYGEEYRELLDEMETLAAICEKKEYENLRVRALWVAATAANSMRDTTKTPVYRGRASLLAEQIRDVDLISGTATMLANYLVWMGNYEEAWSTLGPVLENAQWIDNPRRQNQMLDSASYLCMMNGNHDLALLYRRIYLEVANNAGEKNEQITGYTLIARLSHRIGDREGAEWALRKAEELLSMEPEGTRSDSVRTQLEVIRAELAEDPSDAIEFYRSALQWVNESGSTVNEAEIRTSFGAFLARERQLDEAREQLTKAIALYETDRTSLDEQFTEARWDSITIAFDTLIALEVEEGNHWRALEVADQKRARVLLDRYRERRGGFLDPVGVDQILESIDDHEMYLYFALVDEALFLWTVCKEQGIRFQRSTVPTSVLRERVTSFIRGIEANEPLINLAEDQELLSGYLTASFEDHGARHWTVFPDDVLHKLPFSLLLDRAGELLLQSRTIVVSPSLAFSQVDPEPPAPTPGKVLVAAVTHHAPVEQELSPLPRAESEARAISRIYGDTPLITDATAESFLSEIAGVKTGQFSGHALINRDNPGRSRLLFADRPLFLEELTTVDLDLDLMILSACSTAFGAERRTEGITSMARYFHELGCPTVLASLWTVPDQAAEQWMIRFHNHRASGMSVPEAHRAATLASQNDNPREWAGFQVYGRSGGGLMLSIE